MEGSLYAPLCGGCWALDADICLSVDWKHLLTCLLQMLQSEKIPTTPEWISLGLAVSSLHSKENNLTYCKLKEKLSRQVRPGERRNKRCWKGLRLQWKYCYLQWTTAEEGREDQTKTLGTNPLQHTPWKLSPYTKPHYTTPLCDLLLVMNCTGVPFKPVTILHFLSPMSQTSLCPRPCHICPDLLLPFPSAAFLFMS